MVRFNYLKIVLEVHEAKPGGILGAMISPYLFSNNMNDFCKKFNDQTKIYEKNVFVTVKLYCDISEKIYTFFIVGIPISFFFFFKFSKSRKIDILFLYDLMCYLKKIYLVSSYRAACLVFSILRTIKRRRYCIIKIKTALKIKLLKYLNEEK